MFGSDISFCKLLSYLLYLREEVSGFLLNDFALSIDSLISSVLSGPIFIKSEV